MLTILVAAVTATVQPAAVPQRAVFRSSAVSASAVAMGRVLEGVTINYAAAKPASAIQKRAASLLIDGQQVGATLIEFP